MYQVTHFINGQYITSKTSTLDIYNPAAGEATGQVHIADKKIIDQAITAAKSAFPTWAVLPPLKRARILFNYKVLLEQHIEDLAMLITQEQGKTLSDARSSVQRGIDVVEYVCDVPNHLKGDFTADVASEVDSYSIRQPLGICVGITPFNFPAMIPLWMFPMAIACGNTFILKPSEKDPSCAVRLAELAQQAGVPDGVLNVVQGDKAAADLLITQPDVKAVSFVGSTTIAEYVYKTATAQGKRVQAFGGAKNHCILMPDADIEQAVDAIIGAGYGSAGERCMAISVVVAVGEKLADELVKKLIPRIQALKIGSGVTPGIEMGPLVTAAHWERVKTYIELGLKEGAELVVDGRNLQGHAHGFYLGGCLFDKVTPNMRIYHEEIFGPVLSIVRVNDFADALKLVNEHEYGNGTAIFTRDGYLARTFAMEVQTGMVGINIPIPVPVAYHSFGGWKKSMFGDIGMFGMEGVHFYTKLKTVTQRWVKNSQGTEFTLPN